MDITVGDGPGSSEDLTVKKKSRFQILKTRLFGRMKRKDTDSMMKHTQSASDITAPECVRSGDDSEDDFVYSPGALSSRALSHDSIFLTNQSEAPAESERVLSQENVHSRIRALQMKVQQNIRLGPPPVRIPTKRMDDVGASSEDDGLPHSPPEVSLNEGLVQGISQKYPDPHRHHSTLSLAGTGSEEEDQRPAQPLSHLLSPAAKPSSPPRSPMTHTPVADFAVPAQFIPCLDNSAARHRMSVKPRNQRASTKGRRAATSLDRQRSESLGTLEQAILESKHNGEEDPKETSRCRSYSSQLLIPELSSPEGRKQEQKVESSAEFSQRAEVDLVQPFEHIERVCKSPVRLRPVPQGLEPIWPAESSLTKGPASPGIAELSGAPSNKPQSPGQAQGTQDLVRDILQNYGQRYPSNYTVPPKSPPADYIPPSNPPQRQGDPRGNGVQGVTQAMLLDPPSSPRLSAAANTPKILQSVERQPIIPKTSSLKRATQVTAEGFVQEGAGSASTQGTSAPPTGQDDQQPMEAIRQQKPHSGSFKFSISSAWDRPRTSSFTSGVEGASAKPEDGIAKKIPSNHRLQEHLTAKKEEFLLNPLSVTRTEESLVVNSPSSIKLLQQTAVNLEATKPKELPWTSERRGTMKKGVGQTSEVTEGSVKSGQFLGRTGGVSGGKEVQESFSSSVQAMDVEDTQGRSSFGVKLRSTALSLKYRSDLAQLEQTHKCPGAEVCPPTPQRPSTKLGISEDQRTQAEEEDRNSFTDSMNTKTVLVKKPASQNPETHPYLTASGLPPPPSPRADGRQRSRSFKQGERAPPPKPDSAPPQEAELPASEPVWMTAGREKTQSLQQLFTSRLTASSTPQAPPQTSPQPVSWERGERRVTSSHLSQEKAARTSPVERKVDREVAAENRSPLMPKKAGWQAQLDSRMEMRKGSFHSLAPHRPPAEGRCEAEAGTPLNVYLPDTRTPGGEASPSASSEAHADKEEKWRKRSELQCLLWSSSPSLSPAAPIPPVPASGSGQPSWLELAKRKSLAWSDKICGLSEKETA